MKDTLFFKQAELLLHILPFLKQEHAFALKGGTAINFFHRNLPRLSMDIDLTYLPINMREIALADISQKLESISERIKRQLTSYDIVKRTSSESGQTIGFLVKRDDASVKIEPNLVVRGSVYPSEIKKLCIAAEEEFELTMYIQTLSFADLYGSKICAALDRQHPRDLYDIHQLITHEGFTDPIREAFLVYLISHPRPMVELLNPNKQDIKRIYEQEFHGMMIDPVSLDTLIHTCDQLIKHLKTWLTDDEKRFLLSVKEMTPDWELLGIEHVQHLPAVQWKLQNLSRMSKTKHTLAVEKLKSYLDI